MSNAEYLLDINVLVALVDDSHSHHNSATEWFDSIKGKHWGVCTLTEAGFLRVMTRPATGCLSVEQASDVLARLTAQPGYRFWPLSESWSSTAGPFKGRVFGHQQITDALLLGLAVKEGGILVTFDKAIGHIAGRGFAGNLLVLQ